MDKFRLVKNWETRLVNDGDGHFDEMDGDEVWFVAEEMHHGGYLVVVEGPFRRFEDAEMAKRNREEGARKG